MNVCLLALASATILAVPASAQSRVLIIESQSINSGHVMDTQWETIATAAGHVVTVGTQATLETTAFHASTDILIVSSGVITLTPAQESSISAYLAQGGSVYLQGEYLITYSTNELCAQLVSQLGGSFLWSNTVSGDLRPVTTLAPMDAPNPVAPLDYYWYGATGVPNGPTAFLTTATGVELGWTFDGPVGRLVFTTDQDWIREPTVEDEALMENILDYLSLGGVGAIYCDPGVANSTGVPGEIRATGSAIASANSLTLRATSLPVQTFGIFLASRQQGFFANAGGSEGNLCLGGAIGRYVGPGQIQNTGATGQMALLLDLTMTPQPTGLVPVQAGETWHFQAWHRDSVAGTLTSNFTNAVTVVFI